MADLFSSDALISGLAAFTILGFWLVLYRESVWHRIVENLLVGGSMANILIQGLTVIADRGATILDGEYHLIVPVVLGCMLFFTLLPRKWAYYSHWGTAILVGVGLGLALRQAIWSDGGRQIIGAIGTSLVGTDALGTLSNVYMLLATLTGVFYFIFTMEPKSPALRSAVGGVRRFGRIALMGAFGTIFGSTMIARWNSGITAFDPYMITGWGPIIIAIAGIYIVQDIIRRRQRLTVRTT